MTIRSKSTLFHAELGTRVALGAFALAAAFGCSNASDSAASSGGADSGGAATSGASNAAGALAVSGAPGSSGAPGGSGASGDVAGAGGAAAGGAAAGGAPQTSGGRGGSAGASGGVGNSGDYNPCPSNGDPCKILPLGDSITWGVQYDGAYRVELFARAVAAGQKLTFTGSLVNGPGMVSNVAFPPNNDGHSGWTIDQEAGIVPSPAFTTLPNIVLLEIGTNDVYADSGQADMSSRLSALMDKIIAAAPNALLVVAQITPLENTTWNATVDTYNAAIPGVIEMKAASGKHVIGVDNNTGFMKSAMLSSDGIHPNKAGYDWMGDNWYAAISKHLPK